MYLRTIHEHIEEVESCQDRCSSGANDAVRKQNREEDTKSRTRAEVDCAVRPNAKGGRDHLCTAYRMRAVYQQERESIRSRRTHHVKSIEHTKVTCPVTFAQPVIQLARGAHLGGASFAEK